MGPVADADGDGWAHWILTQDVGRTSIWTVVDMTSGRLMAGEPGGTVPRQSAFPAKMFLRDAAGIFSNLIVNVSQMPAQYEYWELMWVRPGTGSWALTTGDGFASDRDRGFNGLIVLSTSAFEPLTSAPTPPGFLAGDVLVGIEAASYFWFGDAVADHLGEASGPGVLSMLGNSAVAEETKVIRATILRRAGSDGSVSIRYATEDNTAIAGVHYEGTAGTLELGPGELVKTIEIPILDDLTYSGDTSFKLTLSDPAGATVEGATSKIITIVENDPKPNVTFSSATVQEGPAGTREVSLDVTLAGATRVPASGTWHSRLQEIGESPVPRGTLSFAPGETRKTIVFSYEANEVPDLDRRYTIAFSNPEHATQTGGQVTIIDDDFATLSMEDVTFTERSAFTTITIRASSPGKPITVKFTTVDGTATAGTDYLTRSGTLELNAKESQQTVGVEILNDALREGNESFTLVLSDATGATINDGTSVVTILDDEPEPPPLPTLTIADWSGPEHSDATWTVRLSAAAAQDVTVLATTRPGTAEAQRDFVASSTTLRIPAGQTAASFAVRLIDDHDEEPNETFTVELSQVVNATLARAVATGTIVDDDETVQPIVTIGDASIMEGNAGVASLRIHVELSSPAQGPISVSYATASVTAVGGTDYLTAAGELTFAIGDTGKTITIGVLGDTLHEPDEQFAVHLVSASGAMIGAATASCTIINDDAQDKSKRRSVRH